MTRHRPEGRGGTLGKETSVRTSWSGVRRALLVALLVSLVVLVAGCTPSHPQSTFDAAGPVAQKQLTLFWIIFWAAAFVFVAVEGILLYSVIRFRRKPGQGDPPQIHGHRRLEIAWTIAPAIVLAVIAVPTVITLFELSNSPDPEGLQVNVTGHQWWWEFEYPQLNVVTANELHIPVGEVVNLSLQSNDVLHSFWVPKLGGKTDIVPGNTNTMWLEADEEGTFLGQCAEFCGIAHAHMRLRVIAEPKEKFDAWVQLQQEPAELPIIEPATSGQKLFESIEAGCFACHTIEGSNLSRGTLGPNLTHLAGRTTIVGFVDNTEENLNRWLRDPDALKRGNIMAERAPVYTDPDKALSEEEISALVAYLQTLK